MNLDYRKLRWFVFVKRNFNDESGTSAVEFALVMPVFLGMMLGVFWVGWAAYSTHSVHHALEMAARALQLKPTTTQSQLQTIVRDNVTLGDDAQQIVVTLQLDAASGGTQLAHTTATFPVTFTVPLVGTYSMTYTTSMTVAVLAT